MPDGYDLLVSLSGPRLRHALVPYLWSCHALNIVFSNYLCAYIVSLSVAVCGIVSAVEQVNQLLIFDLTVIVRHLNSLGVACAS
jgi:uncharacterized integral membrane protein